MFKYMGIARFSEDYLVSKIRCIFTDEETDFLANYIITGLGSYAEFLSMVVVSYMSNISHREEGDQNLIDIQMFLQTKVTSYNPDNLIIYHIYDNLIYGFDPNIDTLYSKFISNDFFTDTFNDIVDSFDFGYSANQSEETTEYITTISQKLSMLMDSIIYELSTLIIKMIKDNPVCYLYVNTTDRSCDFLVFT